MLVKLTTHGNGSTVFIDATFGTNKYAIGTSPEKWRPSCFLTDDAKEENLTLRYWFSLTCRAHRSLCVRMLCDVPNVPVNLCLWHVRSVWLRKLHAVVKDPFAKAAMNVDLGRIMYGLNEHAIDQHSEYRFSRALGFWTIAKLSRTLRVGQEGRVFALHG
ncbi:hypothetical protein R1sor_007922 [Riccia sorocarpa]|uniref:Uncharacterized protein n=1 Tax=Riccia sorocarpa TaxID=122646 RepID=A0ABD3HW08_9MARC